jgi:hypothetical protein
LPGVGHRHRRVDRTDVRTRGNKVSSQTALRSFGEIRGQIADHNERQVK